MELVCYLHLMAGKLRVKKASKARKAHSPVAGTRDMIRPGQWLGSVPGGASPLSHAALPLGSPGQRGSVSGPRECTLTGPEYASGDCRNQATQRGFGFNEGRGEIAT